MKELSATVAMIVGILVLILGMTWLFQGNDFFMYKYFAPKYENARREVFENTKSYNQGTIQELENMQYEYIKANPNHQDALASIILHRAADFPQDKLPYDLKVFINDLKTKRNYDRTMKLEK